MGASAVTYPEWAVVVTVKNVGRGTVAYYHTETEARQAAVAYILNPHYNDVSVRRLES